jgi:hypothetical protein
LGHFELISFKAAASAVVDVYFDERLGKLLGKASLRARSAVLAEKSSYDLS